MTKHAVLFENADIVGSGDGWVAYLEEAKAQAEAMVNESK